MHYLLQYELVDGYVERRQPFRPAHFALAQELYAGGDLVLAGALTDPVDGAVFVFRSEESARRFAENDPYVKNGLVPKWTIRKWTTVLGDGVEPPKL